MPGKVLPEENSSKDAHVYFFAPPAPEKGWLRVVEFLPLGELMEKTMLRFPTQEAVEGFGRLIFRPRPPTPAYEMPPSPGFVAKRPPIFDLAVHADLLP